MYRFNDAYFLSYGIHYFSNMLQLHKTKPKIQKSDIDEQLQQLTLSSGQLRCEQAEYLCSTSDQAVQQDGGLELSGKRYFRQKDQYSTSLHVRNPFSRHQLKATLPHRVKESVEKAANSATFFLTQVYKFSHHLLAIQSCFFSFYTCFVL